MQTLLARLTPADYTFLIGLIESPVSLTDDRALRTRLAALEASDTPDARAELNRHLEREIRYLGSADLAYGARYLLGVEPGVPFREIVRDVADALKIGLPRRADDTEKVKVLVQAYAADRFRELPPARQQEMLESLGVSEEQAADFLKRSAGRFAIPAMVEAFGYLVVDRLIKGVIFGAISRLVGKQVADLLFAWVARRFPWWVRWIGPAVWTVSFGFTALDLQGPATRKTIPLVLYLGLCALREDAPAGLLPPGDAEDEAPVSEKEGAERRNGR